MGVPAASGCLAAPERRHVAVENLNELRQAEGDLEAARERLGTVSPARRGTAYPYVSRTPIPPPSDLRVAGSREGVDAVGGQAEGDEGEQPLPEGLLLQGAHRAVEAAGLATVLVPGREDEESAHDQ